METVAPMQLMLRIADSATPNKRALPEGATAAQVYMYLGATMPTNYDLFTFYGLASKASMPINLTENGCHGGAFFRLQWVNRKGETGPWSDIIVG